MDHDFLADQFRIIHKRLDNNDKILKEMIELQKTAQLSRKETLRLLNEFMKTNALTVHVKDNTNRINNLEHRVEKLERGGKPR